MKLAFKGGMLWALGTCGFLTLAAGGLIYYSYSQIDEEKATIERKEKERTTAKTKIAEIEGLEKRVMILREVVKDFLKILPDSKEVNGFVKKIYGIQDETGVQITELNDKADKNKKKPGAAKSDEPVFEKVGYSLKLEGDTWKFLSFLNRLESFERFVRVPKIKVKAGKRDKEEDDSTKVVHEFELDLETYVFDADGAAKEAAIPHYNKRVADLRDEIARVSDRILADPYEFHGARGRRDPFLDPRLRIPPEKGGEGVLARQAQIVEELRAEVAKIGQMVLEFDKATQMLQRFQLRRDIEVSIASVMDKVGKIEKDGKITYAPLLRRMHKDVTEALATLRQRFDPKAGGDVGPTRAELEEVALWIREHLNEGEFTIAMDRYRLVADRLKLVENDPDRKDLVELLRRMNHQAGVGIEFGKKKIQVDGIIVSEQGSVAVINGRAFGEGDYLDDDLMVRKILPDAIEFQYRDVVISRKI